MAKGAEKAKAFAYLRTSSAANVGTDKDSDKRQRAAIQRYAKGAGFQIVAEYYDAAVSGADAIEARPGFGAMLDAIEGNGVRVVIIEETSRFARDLVVQEIGLTALAHRGVRVITANGDDLTNTDDPMKKLMRQIAGCFAEFERARIVAKLKHARDRKSNGDKRIEGRRALHELYPDAVTMAKRLRRASPKTGERMSFRDISAKLAKAGLVTKKGTAFGATAVKRMVEGPAPKAAKTS